MIEYHEEGGKAVSDYRIFADSACDISPAALRDWGVSYCQLTFRFDDSDRSYENYEMPADEFYRQLQTGRRATTSSVNTAAFLDAFRPVLEAGEDILYLGFSGGLSATTANAFPAAQELREAFPDRKILIVDTLAASAGYGLLLYLTVQKKLAGASLEEAAAYAEAQIPHICHWFTVDNLKTLLRGGRVKTALASLGGALDLKPVRHTDNEGHLTPVSIARGRKGSLKALVNKYASLALHPSEGPVFISHGACPEDVKTVDGMLRERFGQGIDLIADVGPVIGSHTGAGVIALFFLGKER